jgi:hypothetical protein
MVSPLEKDKEKVLPEYNSHHSREIYSVHFLNNIASAWCVG